MPPVGRWKLSHAFNVGCSVLAIEHRSLIVNGTKGPVPSALRRREISAP
jgi:hypothetical protein